VLDPSFKKEANEFLLYLCPVKYISDCKKYEIVLYNNTISYLKSSVFEKKIKKIKNIFRNDRDREEPSLKKL